MIKKGKDWSLYNRFINGMDEFPWITIVIAVVIVGQLLWLFERKQNKKMPKEYGRGLYLSLWLAAQLTFFKNGFQIKSLASKVLIGSYSLFMWKFMILFVVATILKVWTSGLLYTSTVLPTGTSDIWMDENYQDSFSEFGISGSAINWNTKSRASAT